MKSTRLLPHITALYITALLLRPVLAAKIISVAGWSLPGGIIAFPLSFVCNDILTEIYGYEKSRSVVWIGLVCQLIMAIALAIIIAAPAGTGWQNQTAFSLILGQSARASIASLFAYLVGEIVNSQILSRLKYRDRLVGKDRMSRRFVLSTLVGEFADSTIYITIAFLGVFSNALLVQMILTTWIAKTAYEILCLPFSVRIVTWIKQQENTDMVDEPGLTDYGIITINLRGTSI